MNWARNVVVHVTVAHAIKIKRKEAQKYMEIYMFVGHVIYL